MKTTTHPEVPVSLRLPGQLVTDVNDAAKRLTLSKAATLRLAIQRGLPLVLQNLAAQQKSA